MTIEIDTEVCLSQCVSNKIQIVYVKSYLEIRKWWYKEYDFNWGYLYSVKVIISYYDIEVTQLTLRDAESVLSR